MYDELSDSVIQTSVATGIAHNSFVLPDGTLIDASVDSNDNAITVESLNLRVLQGGEGDSQPVVSSQVPAAPQFLAAAVPVSASSETSDFDAPGLSFGAAANSGPTISAFTADDVELAFTADNLEEATPSKPERHLILSIENKTVGRDGGFRRDEIFVLIQGKLDGKDHRLDWVDGKSVWKEMLDSDNTVALDLIGTGQGRKFADYARSLADIELNSTSTDQGIRIPVPIEGGRAYISLGRPVYLSINPGGAPAEPNEENRFDVNYDTILEKFEFTALEPEFQLFSNTTAVDAVGIPLIYQLTKGTDPPQGPKGFDVPRIVDCPMGYVTEKLRNDPVFSVLVTEQPSFYVWRRELRKRDLEGSQPGASGQPQCTEDSPRPVGENSSSSDGTVRTSFVAVDVVPSAGRAIVQIDLPGGVVVHVPADVSAETLERVLRVVTRPRNVAASGAAAVTADVCEVSSC